MNDNPVIFAIVLDGAGGGTEVSGEEAAEALHGDKVVWVHLDREKSGCRAWIDKTLDFLDPVARNALQAEETRPRAEEFTDGLLVILRAANLNENAEPDDMIALRLWIDDRRLITMRRRKILTVEDIRARLKSGSGARDTGDLLAQINQRLVERMGPIIESLDDEMDDLEERVLEMPDIALRHQIVALRRKVIKFRRHMAPQREVVSRLRNETVAWLNQQQRALLQEVYHNLIRFVEELDSIRERSQIVQDELANTIADRMNQRMYMLSVVAAIFLPLGFLTGLMGINVAGIPGAGNSAGFILFVAFLVIIVVAQYILFKKKGWF